MAIIVTGISTQLDDAQSAITANAALKLGVKPADIAKISVKRQSVDARRQTPRLVMTALVELHDAKKQQALEQQLGRAERYTEPHIAYGSRPSERPVVIGAGPCGLFAALTLAEHGYKPLLLERGQDMPNRERDVAQLKKTGIVDPQSNVCFGAGGAGAFSDGKLTTRISDPRSEYVLQTLADCGAPQDILSLAHPHTGTEYIRKAVEGMIGRIKALGGEMLFGACFCGVMLDSGGLRGIQYSSGGALHTVDSRAAIIGIGHSARDTYQMLHQAGVVLEPKPFAVGLRIEHLRESIDKAQYGKAFGHPRLGAAEYRLAGKFGSRSVYSFCMCPGGEVINASTDTDGIVVNGMSYHARDGMNSNSAVVVGVSLADFEPHVFGGVAFQQQLERAAFALAGCEGAPVQSVGGFLGGAHALCSVKPSFAPNAVAANLHACLPGFITGAIQEALRGFGKKLHGFDSADAVLTGVETRTSSPVRIKRTALLHAEGIDGLYPAGEGAGYAGGIVSAAVDGIKCAKALMEAYARPQ